MLAHLKDIDFWPPLDKALAATQKVHPRKVIELIAIYMQMTFIHHGFRDIKLGTPETPTHFARIYYAYDLYKSALLMFP